MPLSRMLQQQRDPRSVVAWRWSAERATALPLTWEGFQRDVAGARARLRGAPPGRWLLASEDAYAFAVGLFALWHSGRSAISPPNHQPGTLEQLQTEAAGVLSDRADWFPAGEALDPCGFALAATDLEFGELDANAPALELFTSGTTGAGKSVSKRLSNLQEEVKRLEQLFGARGADSVVFGTASHQHLYAMLFRVLWPIAYGRAFQSDLVLHTSELVPRMRERGKCILASVPSHLKRMVRQRGVRELAELCGTTFSSGGLLQTETAQAWKDAVGEAPIEVFGSTETGGIAWRAQNRIPEDLGWTPFPDVTVGPENSERGVRIRSPFVSSEDPSEGFTIGDRIAWLADGRFTLEGRADRVVKVGEKRLDLAQMESSLRAHPFVEEAALLLVDQEGDARVAGVVVPSEAGSAFLAAEGRIAYGRSLAESLAPHWDRVSLPRLWRTVDALPENAQGKVSVEALRALFASARAPAAEVQHAQAPELIGQQISERSIVQTCEVPRDLVCFDGHFPGFPVVPGVVQVGWAMNVAGNLLGFTPEVRELEALKFASVLTAGDRFELRVDRPDRNTLHFRLSSGDREFSSGRARIAPEASE